MDPASSIFSGEKSVVCEDVPVTPPPRPRQCDCTPNLNTIPSSPTTGSSKKKLRSTFRTIKSALKSPLGHFATRNKDPSLDSDVNPPAKKCRGSVKALFATTRRRSASSVGLAEDEALIERHRTASPSKTINGKAFSCPQFAFKD